MLNKTLILSTIFLYTLLLTLVGWQQAKVIPWNENTLLRIRFTRPEKPPRIPEPKPAPFSLSVPPLTINQQNWAELQFRTAKSLTILKLKKSQSSENSTLLIFEGGARVTLDSKDDGIHVSLKWPKEGRAGELRLSLPLQPGYKWEQEQSQPLATNGDERWLLSSEYAPKIQNASLALQLANTRKNEISLFTLAPAPLPENKFSSDYAAYIEQLEQLIIENVPQNTSPSPNEIAHYLAANLRQGLTPKQLSRPADSYLLAPYLGLDLSVLRQQVALDRKKSAALLLRTPEQIIDMRGNPSPAIFLFNHYQLDKLRQLLRYSLSTLADSSFEQRVNRLLILSEILLINPVMVSAQGNLAQIDQIIRQNIIPTAKKWLESPPSSLPLRQQLKTIAVLRNWAQYSNNPSSQKLAEQLTLQLQQHQDASGNVNRDGQQQIGLSELLDWVGPTEYRSMERSVTPGFWIQGISAVQTDYRPGYFIRINSSFPAGKTQYLILRGIYFQPRQVFFDQKPQPHRNWTVEPSALVKNSWYYNRELKTLVIQATHAKKNLVIDIPY